MKDIMSILISSVMVVGVFIAAFEDIRTRRIPNILTGVMASIAIVANIPNGLISAATAALVMLVVFMLGTVAFSLGWFGGGDVKLIAALGGLAGFPNSIELIFYILIGGSVVSLVEIIRQRKFKAVLASTQQILQGSAPVGQVKVPYGIGIAMGTWVYVLLSFTTVHFLRLVS
jgi:prepilin peptidase CpaA